MTELQVAPKDNLTSQIYEALKTGYPCTSGSFGVVYRCTIKASDGPIEVAVKVFKVDPGRGIEKNEKATRRELMVWLRLNDPTIVPLLGIAYIEPPFPALVSRWMPSGTLYTYIEEATTLSTSGRVALAKGVADGLMYLHSENVIHGDLHPGNVLIDGSGNPRLTDFGLATVVGDAELQLSSTTASRALDPRWRAPEVIGMDHEYDPGRPTFKSDIYSFGGLMFFVISGDVPWKEKKPHQIYIELWKRANPARPDNILDDYWDLIQRCWYWDPGDRPKAVEVFECIATKITTTLGKTEMAESTIRTTPPEMADRCIDFRCRLRRIFLITDAA
ncbi:kinase-like domain-containing protein [Suillus clintonianus]|uniref:kinase-like domain-containing protein n=1 Tax=Suillus clintonianus TaxID=1904413 RepID=UPI001B88693E|nr:kinase-like domain-containing protein [Suillus clintonianus]KAG2153882.1 kinase-like domain-containing protein [Suillus clintonianus]